MDPIVALLVVIMIVLTVLLVIVGVQVILILKDFQITLKHINHTLKNTDDLVAIVNSSFSHLGNSLTGLKSGLQLMDIFFNWLKERQSPHGLPNSD